MAASAESAPQGPLEQAIAAHGDERPGDEILGALAGSTVLVMIELEEGQSLDDPDSIPEGTPVGLSIAEVDDVPHVPVFTSPERMDQAGVGEEDALEVPATELAAGWPVDIPMAVNPGCEIGISIAAEDVRSLAPAGEQGPAARSIESGTEIHVTAPVTEPEATLERVRAAAVETAGVVAAHRAVFTAGRDAPPQLAIGIELAEGADEQAILKTCADAAGPGVALLPVRTPPANPIDAWMAAQDAPFYRRGG